MDVDSDEEDKRLKDRALREYKQDSDEQGHPRFLYSTRNFFSAWLICLFDLGPQSKANFVVLRRKKKQRREQKIANLKLKPKRKF